MRWILGIVVVLLSACGAVEAPADVITPIATTDMPDGRWQMEYLGECAIRDPIVLDVRFMDDQSIEFGDYTLNPRENSSYYSGSNTYTTFLESCQRNVIFEYEYSVTADSPRLFTGTESITEVGVGTETCSIRLTYVDSLLAEVDNE